VKLIKLPALIWGCKFENISLIHIRIRAKIGFDQIGSVALQW